MNEELPPTTRKDAKRRRSRRTRPVPGYAGTMQLTSGNAVVSTAPVCVVRVWPFTRSASAESNEIAAATALPGSGTGVPPG